MTQEGLKKLRAYYHSLLRSEQVLEDAAAKGNVLIEEPPFRTIEEEIYRIQTDFPNFLPTFTPHSFADRDWQGSYNIAALRSYLAAALGRLKVEIDTDYSPPVTEPREFLFVKEVALRKILERDYQEIQRAYVVKAWKSVIILAGSAIEAILTDLLLQNPSRAKAAATAPAKNPDITSWGLADLIKVSVELNLIHQGVEKLSHSIREYRNLVHPGLEIRKKLTFDAEEARIALEVLHMIHRHLSS